jgi:hypothetical protein
MKNNIEYERLRELSDMDQDRNSCSVISLAAGLEISYLEAKRLLSEAGRRQNKGAHEHVIKLALHNSGVDCDWTRGREHVADYKHSKTLTFNNAVRILDVRKKFLLIGTSHMVALKYGEVVDWAKGRKMRVDYVVEIIE